MDHQTINPNQNITMPSSSISPLPKRKSPAKTLEEKRDERSDNLEQQAKDFARTGYDTENQLSSNLITVTLAFVALIAATISSSDVLDMLKNSQRWTILIALVIFCFSILAGLINYFYNMRFHQRTAALSSKYSDQIDNASTIREVDRLNKKASAVQPSNTSLNNFFIFTQSALLFIGLALVVTFVGTLLFR